MVEEYEKISIQLTKRDKDFLKTLHPNNQAEAVRIALNLLRTRKYSDLVSKHFQITVFGVFTIIIGGLLDVQSIFTYITLFVGIVVTAYGLSILGILSYKKYRGELKNDVETKFHINTR